MKIEFETDINGYQQARKFKSLLETAVKNQQLDHSLDSLASSLLEQLNEFLAKPEFTDFSDGSTEDSYTASHDESATEGLAKLWRYLFGPGKRELELSKQRQTLIERAENAERSAFDALAETAEIGRERDQLRERLKELEAELKKNNEKA